MWKCRVWNGSSSTLHISTFPLLSLYQGYRSGLPVQDLPSSGAEGAPMAPDSGCAVGGEADRAQGGGLSCGKVGGLETDQIGARGAGPHGGGGRGGHGRFGSVEGLFAFEVT